MQPFDSYIRIRVSTEQKELITKKAHEERLNISEFIRTIVLGYIEQEEEPQK